MTNTWLLCATTAVALIATPALAASDSHQGSGSPQVSEPAQSQNQAQPSSAPDAIGKALRDRNQPASPSNESMDNDSDRAASAGEDGQGDQALRMAQRRLRAALKEAGFTDVRIVDTTYMVKARDENGRTVMMSVNPSSMNRGGMGRGAMNHDAMDHDAMNRGAMNHVMNRDAMNGDDMAGVAESGGGYGPGAADETRGEGGADARARGHGQWGGGHRAFERAYERGFRDGYSRGFDSAQRR